MKYLALLLGALLLSACTTAPLTPPPDDLYADHLFQPADDQIPTEDIFALTPEMKLYAANLRSSLRGKEARRVLFDALYKRDQLQLEYDSTMTRTAAQAFEARQGNCLSLIIMTAALAEEMDIPVVFQNVLAEDSWTRSGRLYFNSAHVNILLGKPIHVGLEYDHAQYALIDFIPPREGYRPEAARAIDKKTVVAMFMNNRAAEALAQQDLNNAYWWARKAIAMDPGMLHAYNTLAVIYLQHGNLAESERALRYVLKVQPENTMVISNMVQVLQLTGADAEANALKARLAELQPYPPFHFFLQGQQAMKAGDFLRARRLFERELAREPDYHEFHFWLAAAALQLGDLKTADQHMAKAVKNSTSRSDSALYTGKLDRLRALQAQNGKAQHSAN